MTVFYWVVKVVLYPLLRAFRPWAEGVENVPRTGPAILASNHLSFSDHFFAPLPLPRKVVFLAKSEYFTGRGLKGLFSKAFFKGMGQIPVDRTGGEASERALHTGLRVLAGGELLGIYPEGTRTPDGRLYRGKTGVARLALEARVPVIPTAMVGGFEFQPPGKIAPRLRVRPGVRFGKPLDFSRYYGLDKDHVVLRAMTDEIMYELMKLSGQEYVDEYAPRAKSRLQALRNGIHVPGHSSHAPDPDTAEPSEPQPSPPAPEALDPEALDPEALGPDVPPPDGPPPDGPSTGPASGGPPPAAVPPAGNSSAVPPAAPAPGVPPAGNSSAVPPAAPAPGVPPAAVPRAVASSSAPTAAPQPGVPPVPPAAPPGASSAASPAAPPPGVPPAAPPAGGSPAHVPSADGPQDGATDPARRDPNRPASNTTPSTDRNAS